MDDHVYKNRSVLGTPLAEVFSVIIKPYADQDCEVYGSIEVHDCNGTVCIYNYERDDTETIERNGSSIGLSNRERAISACRSFTVYFDLKDKNNGDAELIKTSFDWVEATGSYDECLFANVNGKHGSAEVYYGVYRLAIEANVWAQFIKRENAPSDALTINASIFGRYKKRYNYNVREDLKKYYEISMLECMVDVYDQGIFPFERSVVVVPCHSSLAIKVKMTREENDEPLWEGEVELSAGDILQGDNHKDIEGEYGSIRVDAKGFHYVNLLKEVDNLKRAYRESGIMHA